MGLKFPSKAALPLLVLMGANTSDPGSLSHEPGATVSAGQTCTKDQLSAQLEGVNGGFEFVVVGGPNRFRNLPTTVQLINEIAGKTQNELSMVLRVDEDEVPVPLDLGRETVDSDDARFQVVLDALADTPSGDSIASILSGLDSKVNQKISIQQMGTSYTEVTHSMAETEAVNLVFLAHNAQLQWRFALAADNTVRARTYGENLQSVQVLCHNGSTLPDNAEKEMGSFLVDTLADFAGHEFIMETSEGGHRWGRMKEKLFSFIGY